MKGFGTGRHPSAAVLLPALIASVCLLSLSCAGRGIAERPEGSGLSERPDLSGQTDGSGSLEVSDAPPTDGEDAGAEKTADAEEAGEAAEEEESGEFVMKLKIGETDVTVDWEDNESTAALKELCANGPLVVECSMYGGFEQVGPLGARLPRNDVPTVTEPGDIVLYSGNQIVVFYGSNSWSYTKLGHITDRTEEELAELLGAGDVKVTVYG